MWYCFYLFENLKVSKKFISVILFISSMEYSPSEIIKKCTRSHEQDICLLDEIRNREFEKHSTGNKSLQSPLQIWTAKEV